MKHLLALLLLFLPACAETGDGDGAATGDPADTNATAAHASEQTTAVQPVASVEAPAPAKTAAQPPAGGPLRVQTDAGTIPAARAERILHVGDSMVPLVAHYLTPLVRGDGRTYKMISIASSTTISWAKERQLQDAMYEIDPDVVLISLGSNELFAKNLDKRAWAIRLLVEHTRGRPCLWIGPPAWKKDYGFIDTLKASLGHCRYFDSTRLDLPRMDDGRHPDWTGGYRWAKAVWEELGGERPVPTGNPRPNP